MGDHHDAASGLLRACVKVTPAHLKSVFWVAVSDSVSYLDVLRKLKTKGTAPLFKYCLLKVLEYGRF